MLSEKTKAEYLDHFNYYSHNTDLTWQDIQGALRELVADGKLYIKSESVYWNKKFWDSVLHRMITNYYFINDFDEAVARSRQKRADRVAANAASHRQTEDDIEDRSFKTDDEYIPKESDMDYVSRRMLMDDDVYYNGRMTESFVSRFISKKSDKQTRLTESKQDFNPIG